MTAEERLKLVMTGLNQMDEGITVFDKELRLVAWNRAFIEFLQFPEGLLYVGLPVSELVRYNVELGVYGKGSPDDLYAGRMELIGKRQKCTEERMRTDGRTFEANQLPMGDGGLIMTYRDISDRERVKEMARMTEERFRGFMDDAPAIAFVKDEESHHLYVNSLYEQLLGISADKIIGKTDAEFWEPERARAHMAQDREILKTGQRKSFEEKVVINSEETDFLVVKFPFSLPDGSRFIGGIATDSTNLKRVEEALRQSRAIGTALIVCRCAEMTCDESPNRR